MAVWILSILLLILILVLIVLYGKYKSLLNDFSIGKNRMYDRLRDSENDKQRLKRQLTQNIAHELKTPVSSISGYLETLTTKPDIDEKTKSTFINNAYIQSKRLTSLLEDISTLNRMDDASYAYDFSEVNVVALLESIRKDVSQRVESKNATLRVLVEKNIEVFGNYSLLYSLFRNLTDNALAYGGDDVSITLQVLKKEEDKVFFSFSDNGPGVPSEHLPHLFERFYRVDKGRSRKLGGTGLGLAIVKNTVILHGGTISVGIGQAGGLEFIFSLPVAPIQKP